MARLTIDTGTVGNTATGDSIRGAFTKVNANFEEIYNELGSSGILSDLSFAGNTISTDGTNQNLILDPNGTGKVIVEGTVDLGGLSFDSQTITGLTTNSNIKLAPAGTGSIDVDTSRIINVTDPTSAQDAATKNYVDTQLSSSSHNFTFVGDDSTGTAVTQGETFKFAGTQNITTAVSGDTLTITGPDLSSYLTSETSHADVLVDGDFASAGFMKTDGAGTYSIDANTYLTSVAFGDLTSTPTTLSGYGITDAASSTATAVTVVGDDSTGTAITLGETFKIAGTQNVTTAVSVDTLTITGPDLSSYVTASSSTTFTNKTLDATTIIGTLAGNNTADNTAPTSYTIRAGNNTSGDLFNSASGGALTIQGGSSVMAGGGALNLYGGDGSQDGNVNIGTSHTASINIGTEMRFGDWDGVTDKDSAVFGDGLDLRIYHDGTDSRITDNNGSGNLKISTSQLDILGGADGAETMATFVDNGAVTLYYDNGAKLATTATGVSVTGNITASNTNVTLVGDDSTGTTINLGETFKIAGTQNVSTAVSGDTLTVTGPDLSNYLQNTGTQTIDNISFNDNIISTASNADLNLNPGGTGQVVANSALKINKGYIEAINTLTSSSTITVDFSTASVHTVTLAENTQFVVTNLPTGGTGTIIITQDGGGSNTGSFGTDGSTAVKFAGGTPTLSTAGGAIDVVTVFNDGVNYLGNIAKAYA